MQIQKMKNFKSSIILSAILCICMCLSLLAGATFALFTSEAKVNIAVTTGKVDVQATLENLKTYSGENLTGDVLEDEEKIVLTQFNGEFINGGTVSFSSNTGNVITLNNLTPGDKVTFDIKVSNNSTIQAMYRTTVACEEDNGLFHGLIIKINDEQMNNRLAKSEYAELTLDENMTIPVSIELPTNAGNEYQGKTCKISYAVEAIQGNAFNGVYDVTPDTVQQALDNASDGDTINLGEGDYGTLYFRQSSKSVAYASAATGSNSVYVNGEKITYSYHPGRTDVTYMRTLKNITIVGSENAKVDNIVFMDASYKYSEDTDSEISGNIIYSEENSITDHGTDTDYDNRLISLFTINNLTLKNINFSGKATALKFSYYSVDEGLSALIYRFNIDGLYFDGCTMTVNETTTSDRMLLNIIANSGKETWYKNVGIQNCTISADRVLVADGVENLYIINNKFNNIKNRDILVSQGGSTCQAAKGNIIISGNESDGSTERFIRIGDASQMNLVITNNNVKNYAGADDDFIKVTGVALSKTIFNNTAIATDGRELTINIA